MNKQAACQIELLAFMLAASLIHSDASAKRASPCVARVTKSVDALAGGDLAAAGQYFNADLAKAKDAEGLKEVWGELQNDAGSYVSRQPGRVVIIETRPYVFVTLNFSKRSYDALAACASDGSINMLEWAPSSDAAAKIKTAKLEVDANGARREAVIVPTAFGPLPGILTLPAGAGRFPAVVIVAGAGSNDADGTLGPNKPYRDLAEGLAAAGVASLRYDKVQRAYQAQAALSENFTVDAEVTRDALTASKLLRGNSRIDPRRQFLLGHSLGAMLAPKIAGQFRGLAGLVLMAPPGEPFMDIAVRQVRYILETQHASRDQVDAGVQEIIDEEAVLRKADPSQPLAGSFRGMPQNYWLSFFRYDPIVAAQKLSLPMLIVQGEKDYKVMPAYSLARWQSAYARDPRVQIKLYPGLNHFFMPAGDLPPPQDEELPGHVNAQVIRDIAAWIHSVPPAQATH